MSDSDNSKSDDEYDAENDDDDAEDDELDVGREGDEGGKAEGAHERGSRLGPRCSGAVAAGRLCGRGLGSLDSQPAATLLAQPSAISVKSAQIKIFVFYTRTGQNRERTNEPDSTNTTMSHDNSDGTTDTLSSIWSSAHKACLPSTWRRVQMARP